METSNTSSLDLNSNKKTIPQFLKVICILTFIMCGIDVINSGFIYFGSDKMINLLHKEFDRKEKTNKEKDIVAFESKISQWEKTADNKTFLSSVYILAAIVCLIGAVMMWQMKKNGFFLYIIGELAPSIAGLFVYGFDINTSSIWEMALKYMLPLTFICLYAVNLKEMD